MTNFTAPYRCINSTTIPPKTYKNLSKKERDKLTLSTTEINKLLIQRFISNTFVYLYRSKLSYQKYIYPTVTLFWTSVCHDLIQFGVNCHLFQRLGPSELLIAHLSATASILAACRT